MDDSVDIVVRDAPERECYEAWVGDELAGYVEYSRHGRTLVLIHTEVEPEFEGHGVGGELARMVLDEARAEGIHVNPRCPFIATWIARHLGYLDLVPEQWRGGISRASR